LSGHQHPVKTSGQARAACILEFKLAEATISGDADLLPINQIGRGLDDINRTWRGGELKLDLAVGVAANLSNLAARFAHAIMVQNGDDTLGGQVQLISQAGV